MRIRIILTGGTIDQSFAPTSPKSFVYDGTHIKEMLAEGRFKSEVVIEDLMALNSEEMTGRHVDKVIKACTESAEDRIVITHGTNTMSETATNIHSSISAKTIVLTGAFVPFSIGKSDALFNLGSALTAVQLLSPGVYVAINGEIFEAGKVIKDRERGMFKSK